MAKNSVDMSIIDSLLAEEEGDMPAAPPAADPEMAEGEEMGEEPTETPMALLDSMQKELDMLRGMLA